MDELNLSEEMTEILQNDPTPEVTRTYKHSQAFRAKRACYMQNRRLDKLQELQEPEPKRSDLSALFEFDQHVAVTSDQMLDSALVFASHLGLEKPHSGETLIAFGTRVFQSWREANFPLLCFGPGAAEEFHLDGFTGSLPILWPAGAELPIDQDKVYWAEALEAMSDRIQAHQLNRKETYWLWNPTTRFYEPDQTFHRPSSSDELADYRNGFRWTTSPHIDHPILENHPQLVEVSRRTSAQDLRTMADEDFDHAMQQLK
jgi:hypothetical protein